MHVLLTVRSEIDDEALSRLHARAFGAPLELRPWRRQLSQHSLTWITARDQGDRLVGFVNVAWDGGAHAFLLDPVVDPEDRHRGLGTCGRASARQALLVTT